ncbi:FAD binding domain-containing protein [Phaeosphaeria sp. MPI-PUGE-AT-0046c]|nr:FAD binding domain-containing protein [Phaeosphaeria sp. MPI-PUGE-AT-0046c]
MGSITISQALPSAPVVSTDYLIVGAGPAGASLACFLARYNLHGIVISAAPGPAKTPRAHITNPPALECIRDLDLRMYDECLQLGNYGDFMKHYRWCETMAGQEYGRAYAFGSGERKGEYEHVSPCKYMDLPQNLLEPVLLKWATANGWNVRFDTKLVGFVEEESGDEHGRKIVAKVVDQITGMEYQVRTKYLFGADGGRSSVAKMLDLPFTNLPGGGVAYNVLLRADMTHLTKHRQGNLHVIIRMDKDYPDIAVIRQIKPNTEWLFVFFPKGPHIQIPKRNLDEWKVICEDLVGDDSVKDMEILDVSPWFVNESSADVISKGDVYCLGDAVHRHPPTLGLGSNTCIQDAFNLSWKIAMVEQNLAHPSLLSTYNSERQPVGAHLVKESNDILRMDIGSWINIGLQPPGASDEDRQMSKATMTANTEEGRQRRKAMHKSVRDQHNELSALGTAMAQHYDSFAVYSLDEVEPFTPSLREVENKAQNYEPSTYPGRRLPHAWLGKSIPGPLVSTLDIAGKGKFTLFTGIGGDAWQTAALAMKKQLGVTITLAPVGRGLAWEDTYLDWVEKCGVEEDGCVLVRPDYFVAWRSQSGGSESERLLKVMRTVLGFSEHGGNGAMKLNGSRPTNGSIG